MKTKIATLLITALTLITINASAQRTANRSFFLEGVVGTSFTSGGAEINFGQYNLLGYWDVGADFMDRALISQHNSRYSYSSLVGFGEYMFRLYGTRDRRFNAYLGAGLYFGAELSDLFHSLPDAEISKVKNRFLFGLWPKALVEFFCTKNIAVTAQFWAPINFNSQIRTINTNLGLGVRYNF